MEAWSHGAAAANSNRLACSTPSSLPPPLSFLLRAAGLQRWGTPAREYRRDFPRAQLPSPAPYLSLPARADPSPFPRARCLLFPLRALRGLLRACFFPRADPPWTWEVALASTRRLGDAFPRKVTPYAGTAWRAGRLHWEVTWTPWRRLGDAVKTMTITPSTQSRDQNHTLDHTFHERKGSVINGSNKIDT